MNKSVLLSIQPKYCELIASGEKTIEVRKSRPKLKMPFKCYIYETKGLCDTPTFVDEDGHCSYRGSGQVIGEFICDRIDEIACHKYHNGVGFDYSYYTDYNDGLMEVAQLSDYDLQRYLGVANDGEVVGYGWHISDLKIYDTPKELGEFKKTNCKHQKYNPPCYPMGCNDCIGNRFERPPQSWCYVEEI